MFNQNEQETEVNYNAIIGIVGSVFVALMTFMHLRPLKTWYNKNFGTLSIKDDQPTIELSSNIGDKAIKPPTSFASLEEEALARGVAAIIDLSQFREEELANSDKTGQSKDAVSSDEEEKEEKDILPSSSKVEHEEDLPVAPASSPAEEESDLVDHHIDVVQVTGEDSFTSAEYFLHKS